MSIQYLAPAGVVLYYAATHYHYGNWGGRGWSGGEEVPPGTSVNKDVDARDPLDETYKQHDIAYENIDKDFKRGTLSGTQRDALIIEADRALVDAYRNLDLNSVDAQY